MTTRTPFPALPLLAVLAAPATAWSASPVTDTPAAATTPPPSDTVTPSPATTEVLPLATRLGAFSTTAFGVSGGGFLNELAGARFDLEYTPRFLLGFSLAYANLKGKDGRAQNVLPEARLGYRLALGRVVGVPFHIDGGYLAKNGPTLRLGAGLDFRLGERVRLELSLLEPMVWVTKNHPEASLNLGIGFSARL